MRELISTNSFNAVGAGQTATLELPVGDLAYHSLQVVYGTGTAGGASQANMESEITGVRIKIDGKVQRTFTAEQLFDINAVKGVGFNTGILPILFSEPQLRTVAGEEALSWGTGDISTFSLEIDIDSGATSPTLSAKAEVSRVRRPMGPIVKWKRFTVPITASGIRNLTNLPKADAYFALHAFSTDIDDVEVQVDQREVFKATTAEMDALYDKHGVTLPTGLTSILFNYEQQVSSALPMRVPLGGNNSRQVSEFRIDFNMSAANTFTLMTETVGLRD